MISPRSSWSFRCDMWLMNPWALQRGGWKPYRSFLPIYWARWQHSIAQDAFRQFDLRILYFIHYSKTTPLPDLPDDED